MADPRERTDATEINDMIRLLTYVLLLLMATPYGVCQMRHRSGSVEALDLRPGFREFKFKAPLGQYSMAFHLQKTDYYRWPEIVEVYTCPYSVRIDETKTVSIHSFFLGNRLVRTTVFLQDTVSVRYLTKYFGKSTEVYGEPETPEEASRKMQEKHQHFRYSTRERWDADMVRMERRVMYLRREGGRAEAIEVLDFYLKDFSDMMSVFMRE